MDNNKIMELEKENALLKIEIANRDALIEGYKAALDEMRTSRRYSLEVKHGIRKIKDGTPGLDEKILKLRKEGKYIKDIASECGVSAMTIHRHLKKMRKLGIKI